MKKIILVLMAVVMLVAVSVAQAENPFELGCGPFLSGKGKILIDSIAYRFKNDIELGAYSEGCGQALEMIHAPVKGEYTDKKWSAGKITELSYKSFCKGFYKTVIELSDDEILKLFYFLGREVYQKNTALDRAEVTLNISSFLQKRGGLSPSEIISFDKYIDTQSLSRSAKWKKFLGSLFDMNSKGTIDVINTVSDDDIILVKQACINLRGGN